MNQMSKGTGSKPTRSIDNDENVNDATSPKQQRMDNTIEDYENAAAIPPRAKEKTPIFQTNADENSSSLGVDATSSHTPVPTDNFKYNGSGDAHLSARRQEKNRQSNLQITNGEVDFITPDSLIERICNQLGHDTDVKLHITKPMFDNHAEMVAFMKAEGDAHINRKGNYHRILNGLVMITGHRHAGKTTSLRLFTAISALELPCYLCDGKGEKMIIYDEIAEKSRLWNSIKFVCSIHSTDKAAAANSTYNVVRQKPIPVEDEGSFVVSTIKISNHADRLISPIMEILIHLNDQNYCCERRYAPVTLDHHDARRIMFCTDIVETKLTGLISSKIGEITFSPLNSLDIRLKDIETGLNMVIASSSNSSELLLEYLRNGEMLTFISSDQRYHIYVPDLTPVEYIKVKENMTIQNQKPSGLCSYCAVQIAPLVSISDGLRKDVMDDFKACISDLIDAAVNNDSAGLLDCIRLGHNHGSKEGACACTPDDEILRVFMQVLIDAASCPSEVNILCIWLSDCDFDVASKKHNAAASHRDTSYCEMLVCTKGQSVNKLRELLLAFISWRCTLRYVTKIMSGSMTGKQKVLLNRENTFPLIAEGTNNTSLRLQMKYNRTIETMSEGLLKNCEATRAIMSSPVDVWYHTISPLLLDVAKYQRIPDRLACYCFEPSAEKERGFQSWTSCFSFRTHMFEKATMDHIFQSVILTTEVARHIEQSWTNSSGRMKQPSNPLEKMFKIVWTDMARVELIKLVELPISDSDTPQGDLTLNDRSSWEGIWHRRKMTIDEHKKFQTNPNELTEFEDKLAASEKIRNVIAKRALSDNNRFSIAKLRWLLADVTVDDCMEFPSKSAVEFGKLYCGPFYLPGFDTCILKKSQDGTNSLLLIQITDAVRRFVYADLRKAAVPLIRSIRHPVRNLYFIYATVAVGLDLPKLHVATTYNLDDTTFSNTLAEETTVEETTVQVVIVYLNPADLFGLLNNNTVPDVPEVESHQ